MIRMCVVCMCMCVCVFMYVHVYVCMCVCMCVLVYVHVCVLVYVCIVCAGGVMSHDPPQPCPLQLQNVIVDIFSLFMRPDGIPEGEGMTLGRCCWNGWCCIFTSIVPQQV